MQCDKFINIGVTAYREGVIGFEVMVGCWPGSIF